MAPSRAIPLHRISRAIAQPLMRRTFSCSTVHSPIISRTPSRTPHPRLLRNLRIIQTPPSTRCYSQPTPTTPQPPDYLNEAELHIFNKIKSELDPVKLEVQDISGGCGSMYALEIESAKFKGLTVIKQHKMVNQVLKEEIAQWHGVQLRTKAA